MANRGKVFFTIGKWNYEANLSDKTTMWQINIRTGKSRLIQRTSKVKKLRIQINTDDDSTVSGKNGVCVCVCVCVCVSE